MPKKKIGIIQLAITLIVLGVAIVLDKITGSDWFGRALNLWPLVLITIGGEILWWQTRKTNGSKTEWKLDGKSIVILTLVLMISGVFHAANTVMTDVNRKGLWNFLSWNGFGPSQSVTVEDKDIDLNGAETLLIENSVGKLTVEGIDGNQAHLRAEARVYSTDRAQAEELAKQVKIKEVNGKNARISVEDRGFNGNNSSVTLVIQVPKNLAVTVKTDAGEIEAKGILSADLQSKAGRIQVSDILGHVKAETNAGEIEVSNAGSADISTDMGRVKVTEVKEKLSVNTHAGEVEVRNRNPVGGDWDVTTDMGRIALTFPKNSSVTIDAKTNMGAINGLKSKSGGPNAQIQEGTGKYQIHARTNAGAIEFDQN